MTPQIGIFETSEGATESFQSLQLQKTVAVAFQISLLINTIVKALTMYRVPPCSYIDASYQITISYS